MFSLMGTCHFKFVFPFSIKRVWVPITLVVLFIVTIILTPSILLVVTASIIKDPVLFTKQFNPEGQRIAHPGHGEGMSIIGDTVGYAKSPLFPYSDIFDNRTVVTNCNPDYREIDVDTIWNIFFVRISSCSWPEQLNEAYYGPYKSTVKLTEL